MSQKRLAAFIHEQTAAIAPLARRISTQEAIRLIPQVLALEEITLGQAIGVLAERTGGDDDPEQQGHNPQALDALRQMQADEP